MTADDMIAYLASQPKRLRPCELRRDTAMLLAWFRCRKSEWFFNDVIQRHGLGSVSVGDLESHKRGHEHAVSNAWRHLVESITSGKDEPR